MRDPYLEDPKWLWSATGLSTHAKRLLVLLGDHKNAKPGQCNPRRKILAAELGVSMPTVTRKLVELRSLRLIQAIKGQRQNAYRIAPRSQWRKFLRDQNDQAESPASINELLPNELLESVGQSGERITRGGSSAAGRLTDRQIDLGKVMLAAGPHLRDDPSTLELLQKVDGILGDYSHEQFFRLMLAKAKSGKLQSFGLALNLARAAVDRAAAHGTLQRIAELEQELKHYDDILADKTLTAEERPTIRLAAMNAPRNWRACGNNRSLKPVHTGARL
jgi:hypothetical protein